MTTISTFTTLNLLNPGEDYILLGDEIGIGVVNDELLGGTDYSVDSTQEDLTTTTILTESQTSLNTNVLNSSENSVPFRDENNATDPGIGNNEFLGTDSSLNSTNSAVTSRRRSIKGGDFKDTFTAEQPSEEEQTHDDCPEEVQTGDQKQNNLFGDRDQNGVPNQRRVRDNISGKEGNDFIATYSKDDTVKGGSGEDTIYAGLGNDSIEGGDNKDRIFGDDDSGGQRYDKQGGNDTIKAGKGDDYVEAGAGNDSVEGNDGHDEMYGHYGNDTIIGGQGNDTIVANYGKNQLSGGIGKDEIYGGEDNDTLSGGPNGDVLFGGGGTNSFNYLDIKHSTLDDMDHIQDLWIDPDDNNESDKISVFGIIATNNVRQLGNVKHLTEAGIGEVLTNNTFQARNPVTFTFNDVLKRSDGSTVPKERAFLALNDEVAGFQAIDGVIELTGYQGDLGDLSIRTTI